ncbi:MAG: hypothetical protein V2A61_00760 [Calditrichota bacterium]
MVVARFIAPLRVCEDNGRDLSRRCGYARMMGAINRATTRTLRDLSI